MNYEFEKSCKNCNHGYNAECTAEGKCPDEPWVIEDWEPMQWLVEWLNSFDTASATECFTAVNLLKEAIENDKR